MILDKAGAKGTGKWTSQEGLDLPIPVPTIDMAVMSRNLSSLLEERKIANDLYKPELKKISIPREEFVRKLHDALYFATIVSYAQGLSMLSAASIILKMDIPLPEVVRVWKGGCIIRSGLLNYFSDAYKEDDLQPNLLLDVNVSRLLQQKEQNTAEVVAQAALNGYPAPGLMASLNYLNAYRRKLLPTNLVQAQRDYFGSHTYERIDKTGIFHTEWEVA
jgi:6-phosphogluconate dehydrogenase